MAQSAPHVPLTYDDLLAASLPDHDIPELLYGDIVYRASPRGPHAWSQGKLRAALDPAERFDGPAGGWWLLVEPDVSLAADTVVRPDLAGWRRSRLPTVPPGPVEIAPDWVCEVLSPGNEAYDRRTKARIYAAHRVPHYWLLHPEERLLEAWSLAQGQWVVAGTWTDGDTAAVPPFEAITLEVGALFLPRG